MNSSIDTGKVVEVAAAVLLRSATGCADTHQERQQFLLAQRPLGKIWAGYWEFPGGKVEVGESARSALIRELREELGIEVAQAYPWLTRLFKYPHATVRIKFFRVTSWQGEPHPHEGQQFSWQVATLASSTPSVSPVLPANLPILRALALPPYYAISNASELGVDVYLRSLEHALSRGVRLIQIREKGWTERQLAELLERAQTLTRPYGAKVLLNENIALACAGGADGVHLTGQQLLQLNSRPDMPYCGASCHSIEELQRAELLGCDFAVLGPVLPTRSHPGAPHMGWSRFAELVRDVTIPVYALGGLGMADVYSAWLHGAHGVAMLRQAWVEMGSSGDSVSSATR